MKGNKMENLGQLNDYDVLMEGHEGDDRDTLTLHREVTVTQYAPLAFREVRKFDHVTDEMLYSSLDAAMNVNGIQNAGTGAGLSGQFFIFSYDKRFILKTMHRSEIDQMIRVLPSYYEHLSNNPKSLIAKIYGVFTVKMDSFEPIHVMIMQNSLPAVKDFEMNYVFDMKGSQVNREVLKKVS
jgi:1-phosphatidylinositol-4-phosphate 5-kinase